jgi:hypothetical protein
MGTFMVPKFMVPKRRRAGENVPHFLLWRGAGALGSDAKRLDRMNRTDRMVRS